MLLAGGGLMKKKFIIYYCYTCKQQIDMIHVGICSLAKHKFIHTTLWINIPRKPSEK